MLMKIFTNRFASLFLFLYGEKVKAYLRAGARALRGETEYPNSRVGWGGLCVSSSLPD